MGESLFWPGGGGGSSLGAIKKGTIVVGYPAGAMCEVTNGSKAYAALDTFGAAAFVVEPGAWTVKVTQSGNTVSKTATVEAGEWVEVQLSFWNGELYEAGNEFTMITGGWAAYSGTLTKAADSLTFSGNNIAAQTVNPVDVTAYRTMAIEVYASGAGLCYCGLSATKQPPFALQNPDIAYKVNFNYHTEKTSLAIDISAASGLMYPTYMSYSGTSYLYKARLS